MKKAAGVATTPAPTRAGKSPENPAAAPASTLTDSVSISPQSKALSGALATQGPFDTSKVEEIKAAITEGRFQINAERIADGLIDSVKEMIHSRKS